MAGLERGERNQVRIQNEDGEVEELTVYDHVTIMQQHYINPVNGYETFHGRVSAGDGPAQGEPDAVTKRVADLMWTEFGMDIANNDRIRVIDIGAENVEEL